MEYERAQTNFEEIHSSFVATYVEVLFKQSTALEAQLREIVSTIITKQNKASWFQHL